MESKHRPAVSREKLELLEERHSARLLQHESQEGAQPAVLPEPPMGNPGRGGPCTGSLHHFLGSSLLIAQGLPDDPDNPVIRPDETKMSLNPLLGHTSRYIERGDYSPAHCLGRSS